MKSFFTLFIILIIGAFCVTSSYAGEKEDCIYGSKIDEMISFYKGCLYLKDSEYKSLSEVAEDAQNRIEFLQAQRQTLIHEMTVENVELQSSKIKSFVRKRMGRARVGLAYTHQ